MSWWDDETEVLGDSPANKLTAAWRRVLMPRKAAGSGPPGVHEALAAYAASLRGAALEPPLQRLVLQQQGGPAVAFTGQDPAPADLRASFDEAATGIARDYREAFDRAPTPMEMAKALDFVVRPTPDDFFHDAATALGQRWSLRAEPATAAPA